jgi:hypothetical protein
MRYFLYLVLCFPFLATAQDKPGKRTCRILFLNPPADAPKKVILFDGTTSQTVELPEMNFSDVYQIAGGETSIRLLQTPVVKAEEIPAAAPGSKVAESIEDFYLVLSSDPSNTVVPVKMQVIDAGSQKFRKGQMMWYNLSPYPVGGQLGSQKLAMKGQSRAIIDAPASGNEPFDVHLTYTLPDDPKFHPLCQTKWVHDPRSRMVMFVYGGGGKTPPELVGFKDFRDAPEEPE